MYEGFETEANMDWHGIPEEEKVSPEEIEAMDAKNAGIIDGYNRKLNKEIKSAIDSGNIFLFPEPSSVVPSQHNLTLDE